MRLEWLQKEVQARCPLCGEDGHKRAVLAIDHVLPGHPRVTLLRCPVCGAAFLQDLTPPDYEHGLSGMLDYYVEQGAGIDLMVAPLLRLPPESVRRCLEVGCSFGFALDFSRHAFGWEVLGVDPSSLAAAGAEALSVPIRRTYFSADLDLGPEPFDLVLCSEILEHLAEPLALLVAMRERLPPEGLLVLSTPNLAIVRREAEEGALGRALSPGLHLMLYDRGALSLLLAKAGFSEVRIEESPETLRAFAACSPAALARLRPTTPAAGRTLLRNYFAARAAEAPPASALACGFAYRHFKECVNAGDYEEAAASRVCLARVYHERFGLDLDAPAEMAASLRGRSPGRPRPFNVTGALYFSGILDLNGAGRFDRAADCFAAALVAGNALLDEQRPSGLCDGETESLVQQSRKHLPMALASTDPDRAVREVEALASLAPELFVEARAQTFIRLVNVGAYDAAERMAPQIARQIDLATLEERGEKSAEVLDPLFCLGMLALHQGRPGEAADLFGRVHRLAGLAGPERAELLGAARYHEALSLREAGQEAPGSRLVIAERFVAPCARLSGLVLPLDVIARQPAARLRLAVLAAEGGELEHRVATLAHPRLSPEEGLRLAFAPFDAPEGSTFLLGALDLSGEAGAPVATDLETIRAAAAGRSPIALDCRGEEGFGVAADLLPDERGIAAFRGAPAGHPLIRTAYWLDAFWCDSHGLYLRGWVHAYEHRVRGLRVESSGRSARVAAFSDRPDLLAFYPEHEHVRHGGFAVYLACPPGHPVTLTLETDGGAASFPLPLPEGPLPAWPKMPEDEGEISPLLRRFADLANARGGRLLQIGARTPPGADAVPPRHLLRRRVIGLDIHPGLNVDLVGDAHGLSRFLREGSVDAVLSASVLEHLQAPWLLAAEINRVLKPGGLVYHEVPGAWPAHAQPNDFWRISAEGLRVLFGPASGFEVLETRDSGPAAIIPSPEWRSKGYLDMPTVPAFSMAEILARKVEDLQPGAVAWPLGAGESETRSRQYPVSGLRPTGPGGHS
ncbi:MAG TPA: methyltransferase domain-containing protein [Thermoanaerobaculia bacterium]|nr:methyltransferase domain-containing protein [Thermoanaerobaculia bacterium]